jgi:hypothetical protein
VESVSKMLACGTSILGMKPAAAAISAVPTSNACAHLPAWPVRPAAKKPPISGLPSQTTACPTARGTLINSGRPCAAA